MATSPADMTSLRPHRSWRQWIPAVLLLLSLLVAGGGSAVLIFASGWRRVGWALVSGGSLVLLGLAGVMLLSLVRHLRRDLQDLREKNASIQQQLAVMAERAVAQMQQRPPAATGLSAYEARSLVLEIRETLLLPEPERQRRYERLVERELERGLAAAERYVLSREFHRAREELGMLLERFGASERLQTANDRLEKAAEATRANDITQATHRVEDLISLARWEEAERIAREVLDKYPVSQEATALVIRVQRERKLYEQRHRQRLFEEIQQSVTQRRWREAATAARTFLQNFPSGSDSDAIKAQMETLEANADIQSRQELEQQLKELLRAHQYWEALALARRIIAEHPLSPQANALRNQIARLEDLAQRQGAGAS